jgi:hypothetical protein
MRVKHKLTPGEKDDFGILTPDAKLKFLEKID